MIEVLIMEILFFVIGFLVGAWVVFYGIKRRVEQGFIFFINDSGELDWKHK